MSRSRPVAPTLATRIRILDGFDDPDLDWDALRIPGTTDEVFQTAAWLRTWWQVFGRGRLLLVHAVRPGAGPLLLPLFADGGMVYLVGAGGSDYLDLLGDSGTPDLLRAALQTARDAVPGFLGCQFHLLPDDSPTATRLAAAGTVLGLRACDEGSMPAPLLDLGPGAAAATAGRRGLLRAERWFQSRGELRIQHLRSAAAVEPHLDAFFAQHEARWRDTPHPSLFRDPRQREFYRQAARGLGDSGALRFTRVDWNGAPIAFHFGFYHRGSFLWYKPSFDPALARRSPGQVLLRALLLAAGDEGARCFDFGIGDEPFKARFANRRRIVRTLGLYPTPA